MVLQLISNRFAIMGDLLKWLWKRKLYWLVPLMIILFIFGMLIVIGATTGLGPFIYPLI